MKRTMNRCCFPLHPKLLCTAVLAIGWLCGLAPRGEAGDDGPYRAAVFGFEFVNWSQEVDYGADNSVEIARLALISIQFRRLLADSGRFLLLDTVPLADRIAEVNSLHGRNGCDARFAAELGLSSRSPGW